MAFLEIMHLTGETERRPLSKQAPVSIGSHRSSDIRIDDEAVEILHCRIAWARDAFEAVAAGTQPLEVNGTPVQRAILKAGDVLRFGSVDIRFQEGSPGERSTSGKAPSPASGKTPAASAGKKSANDEIDFLDDADFEEMEELGPPGDFGKSLDALAAAEKSSKKGTTPPKKSEPAPPPTKGSSAKPAASQPAKPEAKAETKSAGKEPEKKKNAAAAEKQPAARRYAEPRPGEEDLIRSPLVIMLGGISLGLMLIGAIFWFLAFRYTTEAKFNQAKQIYDEGNFRGAIIEFENFMVAHPKDPLAVEAKQLAGMAKIRQHIESTSPNYTEGLKYLRQFVNEQRDRPDFDVVHGDIFEQSKKISLGAAKLAGDRFDPELLKISAEAKTTLKTYAPKDVPPTETLEQIEAAVRKSEAAILEKGVYDEHIARMEQALGGDGKGEVATVAAVAPLKAMQIRQQLLTRYPRFASDRKVRELMERALELEKSLVEQEEAGIEAITEELPAPAKQVSLLFQGRTRTDEVSVGQAVISVAQDCCYGLDLVTGAPIWRRPIGLDSPFFPVIDTSRNRVIVFDTRTDELVCLEQHTGKLLWRQAVGARVRGTPLLTDGSLFASTAAGELLAIEVDTGRLRTRLQFSQGVTSPAEIQSGQLVVAGHEEVLYVLTKRPLECVKVHYIGQPAGSIEAPLTTMGKYLLVAENRGQNATLRLFDTSTGDQPFVQAATAPVTGRMYDRPVIRGRDLFIPSSGERITAFSVSDEPGQPALSVGPSYQGKGGENVPIHLLPGPDRQLWVATVALARLRLTTDALQPDGTPVAPGISTQPLIYEAGYLFNARSRAFTDSVTITRTDRDELTSDWQAILGSKPLAWTAGSGQLLCVNDAGVVFRVTERQWASNRFVTEAASRLPVHEDLATPLRAIDMPRGRLAIVAGDPEPRAWIIGPSGQIEGSPLLPAPPEADPVVIGDRLIVPMPGRLQAVRISSQPAVQDLLLPTGEVHPWLHLLATGADRALAVTRDGLLLNIRLVTSGRAHIAEAGRMELGSAVELKLGGNAKFAAVADQAGRLTILDAERFEQLGQRTLPQPLTSPPVVVDDLVLAAVGNSQLVAIQAATDLPNRWSIPLPGCGITGAALTPAGLVVCLEQGQVWLLDPATGALSQEMDVGSPIVMGPTDTPYGVLLSTLDNTVVPITFAGGAP